MAPAICHGRVAAEAGATIAAPIPAWYSQPQSLDEMVDFLVIRLFDGLEDDLAPKELPLKTAVDDAILLGGCDSVEKVIVLNRTGKEASLKENEIDWHALCKNQKEECEPEWVNAEVFCLQLGL